MFHLLSIIICPKGLFDLLDYQDYEAHYLTTYASQITLDTYIFLRPDFISRDIILESLGSELSAFKKACPWGTRQSIMRGCSKLVIKSNFSSLYSNCSIQWEDKPFEKLSLLKIEQKKQDGEEPRRLLLPSFTKCTLPDSSGEVVSKNHHSSSCGGGGGDEVSSLQASNKSKANKKKNYKKKSKTSG